MKVLVACEFSGIVRDAFITRGHDAVSCDLLPTEQPGPHIQGDVLAVLGDGWDLIVAHPPCTYLASSGARWHAGSARQAESVEFVRAIMAAPCSRIAIENPVGRLSTALRKPDQIIQPWQFGHEATKTTCLWLRGLPPLAPTNVVGKGERHVFRSGKSMPAWYDLSPGPTRQRERSRTFRGIAEAMADQWGDCPFTELFAA